MKNIEMFKEPQYIFYRSLSTKRPIKDKERAQHVSRRLSCTYKSKHLFIHEGDFDVFSELGLGRALAN